jgi:hypothetical protein
VNYFISWGYTARLIETARCGKGLPAAFLRLEEREIQSARIYSMCSMRMTAVVVDIASFGYLVMISKCVVSVRGQPPSQGFRVPQIRLKVEAR